MEKNIFYYLKKEIRNLIDEGKLKESEVQSTIDQIVEEMLPDVTDVFLKTLKKSSSKMLKEHRNYSGKFVTRNKKRWKIGFDLLEMFTVICEESGQEFNNEYRPIAVKRKDYLFESIITLHAKALLITNEIIWLLKGGFADGALSRWRSLHEAAVIAEFLYQNNQKIAERYLASFHCQAYKAMIQYQKYHKQAGLEPFSTEDEKRIRKGSEEVVSKYGKSIKNEYGWAAEILKKERPSFFEIEKHTGLDHWRPRFKWASHYTHANYGPPENLLGMSEATEKMLLIGRSNSGMTNPAHMTAISLLLVTTKILSLQSNFDRIVIMKTLEILSDEIGESFLKVEKKISLKNNGKN